jgi:hypothetical protein
MHAMVDPTEPQGRWHVDKTINLAVIIGLIGIFMATGSSVGAGIWFASKMESRTATLEKRVELAEPLAGQVIRLQTTVDDIKESVTEIKRMIRLPPDQRR